MGEEDRALELFTLALDHDPAQRHALEGSARIFAQRLDYAKSSELLHRLLAAEPNNAPAWMHLGDITLKRGDNIAAAEYYQRAKTVDPRAHTTVAEAQRRLDNLASLRRRYRAGDTRP